VKFPARLAQLNGRSEADTFSHKLDGTICRQSPAKSLRLFYKVDDMAPASLVIMFACKRKLRIAFGLIFWTSLAVAQNASDKVVSDRGGSQLDQAGSATAKSFEPPPEFYRGPGSGSGSNTLSGSNTHSKGFEPPPEFYRGPGSEAGSGSHTLSGSSTRPSLGSVGESLSETYNKWRAGGSNLQDRISVGEFLTINKSYMNRTLEYNLYYTLLWYF